MGLSVWVVGVGCWCGFCWCGRLAWVVGVGCKRFLIPAFVANSVNSRLLFFGLSLWAAVGVGCWCGVLVWVVGVGCWRGISKFWRPLLPILLILAFVLCFVPVGCCWCGRWCGLLVWGAGVGCWCGLLAWDFEVLAWGSSSMSNSTIQSMFSFTGGGRQEGINLLLKNNSLKHPAKPR